jgi:hypothetical protein
MDAMIKFKKGNLTYPEYIDVENGSGGVVAEGPKDLYDT